MREWLTKGSLRSWWFFGVFFCSVCVRETPTREVKQEHARGQLFGVFFSSSVQLSRDLLYKPLLIRTLTNHKSKTHQKTASYAGCPKGDAKARSFDARLCVLSRLAGRAL